MSPCRQLVEIVFCAIDFWKHLSLKFWFFIHGYWLDKKQPKLHIYIPQISTDDSFYFHRQCPSDVTITFHSITSSSATDRCDKNRSSLNLSHFFPKLSTLDLAVAVAASPGFQLRHWLLQYIANEVVKSRASIRKTLWRGYTKAPLPRWTN